MLSQHFWPEPIFLNEVVLSLREAGCEIVVLTGQPNYPDGKVFPGYGALRISEDNYEGIKVHRVPLVPRGSGSALRLLTNHLSFIASASFFGPKRLRRDSFDLIFLFGSSPILQAIAGIVLKRVRGKPLVTWVQDLWPQSLAATGFIKNRCALKLVEMVVSWIYRESDLVLVPSKAFLDMVQSLAGRTPVQFQPNPGDRAAVHGSGSKYPSLDFPPGFNIVFAGNMGTVQALDTILDAAKLLSDLPHLRFILIGSGSRSEWIREQVARLKLRNVELAGRFPRESMPAILAKGTVLLVSLIRSEIMSLTVPSKVQTYMAAGRPLVAALDGEGARVVREAAAGRTCPAENPIALAGVLREMYAAPTEELELMGRNARIYFERNHHPELLAKRLMRRFEEVLSGQPGKSRDLGADREQ